MRLSYLAQDRLDLAETAKRLAQRMREPRELDFVPLKRAARYLVGKSKKGSAEISKTEPSLEEEHDGIGGSDR